LPTNFDPNGVRESYGKMFLTLWNVYRFHADYAVLDGFDADDPANISDITERSPLDRWILSRLSTMAMKFHRQFEEWDFHKACRDLEAFVVNDLSNWYVRRSRRRLWDESDNSDKRACQHTLHEALLIVCRLMAPVAPFMSDAIHRDLTGSSVHLADWPVGSALVDSSLPPQDSPLENTMEVVRRLAETGRRVRIDSDRRQRLPCREGWIVGGPDLAQFHEILAEELNVEIVSTEDDLDRFQRIELIPDNKALGRKCRADLPKVKAAIEAADPESLWDMITSGGAEIEGYTLSDEDVDLRRVEKEGYAAATITVGDDDAALDISLVLDMSITPELLSKGLARDITRHVQAKRKEMDLEIEQTIQLRLWIAQEGPELFDEDWQHVCTETRTSSGELSRTSPPEESTSFEVDGSRISFNVKV